MKRIQTLDTRNLAQSVNHGGWGECQTSCQSAVSYTHLDVYKRQDPDCLRILHTLIDQESAWVLKI